MPCSHNCNHGQSAVNDQNGFKRPVNGQSTLKLSLLAAKTSLVHRLLSSFSWVMHQCNQRCIVAVPVGSAESSLCVTSNVR